MIDIHSHILPDVDDGSENMEMTMSLILRSFDQGVRRIFATPHCSAFWEDPEKTREAFRGVREMAGRYFPEVRVYLGCEVRIETDRMGEVLTGLSTGRLPGMNGTKYVLAEFSNWVRPENTIPCLKQLVDAGWIPIIAHMERYAYLQGNRELVDAFRALGCRIQINVYSLLDEMDEGIKAWARQLVLDRKVDFLGTDMHRTYHRPPSVQLGLGWLYENCEKEYAEEIAFGNARRLLRIGED